jgi:tetratricopeptide (TPR) repeat protein
MANFRIGTLRLARLDSQGALDSLETAVSLQPNHAEARNLLGTALARLGRSTDAIAQFRLALGYRPGYMNAQYNLARALARAGASDEAIVNYRQILTELPQDTSVHNELGELYLSRREFALAIGQFDETLAIDPGNQTARQDREAAEAAMGRRDKPHHSKPQHRFPCSPPMPFSAFIDAQAAQRQADETASRQEPHIEPARFLGRNVNLCRRNQLECHDVGVRLIDRRHRNPSIFRAG